MINYEDELNGAQLDAVRYLDGPSLVIAGAGSGKTRVLTYKIAYLLENGFEPWSILALTFTNKAANEMKERIAARVGERAASMLWMGTFHSVFSKILRREAHHIGYDPQFTIYDQSDSRSLVKSIIKDTGNKVHGVSSGHVLNAGASVPVEELGCTTHPVCGSSPNPVLSTCRHDISLIPFSALLSSQENEARLKIPSF